MLKNALLCSATLWLVIFVASNAVAAPVPEENSTTTASPNTANGAQSTGVNTTAAETATPLPATTTTTSTENSASTVHVTTEAANSTVAQSTTSDAEDHAKTSMNRTSAAEDAHSQTSQNTTSATEPAHTTLSPSMTSVTEATTTTMLPNTASTTTQASTTTVVQTTALTTVGQTAIVPTAGRPLKLENMKPRDVNQTEVNVIDTKGSCSSALQGALNGSVNIYPEKFIFNVSDSTASDAQGYCAQLNETVQHLHDACAADKEVATSVKLASLSAMFATLCSQNSTELKVMAEKDSPCMEEIKNVTMGCSSFDQDYSYPTEMLIHEMEPNTCKNLTEAKSCIASKLANGTACSPDHQQVVVHLMKSLLGGCSTDDSATTAAAAVDSTTVAPKTTANANTTAAPSVAPTHPSASPSRNAAEGLRLHSIALLMSVAIATAIPVRWM